VIETSALQVAAVDWIRGRLGLEIGEIDVAHGGRPPAIAGLFFVAIHSGPWQSINDQGYLLDEDIGLQVTVSVKSGSLPTDRWGKPGYSDHGVGLDVLATRVIGVVHLQYGLLNNANDQIEGDVNKYVEPLRFRRADAPVERAAEWWSGSKTTHHGYVGMSRTLLFTGARVIQEIEQISGETL